MQPLWDAAARASTALQPFSSCRVVARFCMLRQSQIVAHSSCPAELTQVPDHSLGNRRVVSRGKVISHSSDFGALEIFAKASIAHTDPHVVHAAISKRL